MARKLPVCAYCGQPLKDMDHMLRQSPQIRGTPVIGWHARQPGDCLDKDPISSAFPAADSKSLIMLLRQIEGRGEGRLVANRGWLKVVSSD